MRLAIVEDNLSLLESLQITLSLEDDLVVVGAFSTAEEAVKDLKTTDPEVMLVDLGLPGMSGIEFIGMAKTAMPDLDILVHTVFDDWNSVFCALKAGATGYIIKGAKTAELIDAVRGLYAGGAPMSSKIARMVICDFHEKREKNADTPLSAREQEILIGMEKGWTYKQIAVHLHISPHTVRTHIKNIYEKLHVNNKLDALRKGMKKNSW